MTITLPDDLRAGAESRAKALGFGTVEDYVLDLVRNDDLPLEPTASALQPRNRADLERMIDEGAASGNVIVADEAYWQQLQEKIRTGKLRKVDRAT